MGHMGRFYKISVKICFKHFLEHFMKKQFFWLISPFHHFESSIIDCHVSHLFDSSHNLTLPLCYKQLFLIPHAQVLPLKCGKVKI